MQQYNEAFQFPVPDVVNFVFNIHFKFHCSILQTRYNYTIDKMEKFFDGKTWKLNSLDISKVDGSDSDFILNADGELVFDMDDSYMVCIICD